MKFFEIATFGWEQTVLRKLYTGFQMKNITTILILLLSCNALVSQGLLKGNTGTAAYSPADSLTTDFRFLVECLSPFIDTGLAMHYHMRPFACALMNGGGIVVAGPTSIIDHFRSSPTSNEFTFDFSVIAPIPDYDFPDSTAGPLLNKLIVEMLTSVQDKIRATAMCTGTTIRTSGGNIDVIGIQLDHVDTRSMQYLIPYVRHSDWSITFKRPIIQYAPPFMHWKR